ncbi:hypothetical protein [Micropruina sonneratiae]|uniref:hypothetical protein n=1 Tax=Micropruina sonneratiae TaxID=2986940 RepID=UPI00222655CD|nr:hypothetical protein [Micropruina sp. KQZ13P-5]MCW3156423.1 hypothetical protein [Micropruina sp. KQZ13P-5]
MTTNPPTDDPEEQRWQQPPFQPEPETQHGPLRGPVLVPGRGVAVPPPSSFEAVLSALAKLVWPVAILLAIFTKLSFWPVLLVAIVLSTVLGALRNNLRQRRLGRR